MREKKSRQSKNAEYREAFSQSVKNKNENENENENRNRNIIDRKLKHQAGIVKYNKKLYCTNKEESLRRKRSCTYMSRKKSVGGVEFCIRKRSRIRSAHIYSGSDEVHSKICHGNWLCTRCIFSLRFLPDRQHESLDFLHGLLGFCPENLGPSKPPARHGPALPRRASPGL